MKFLCVRHHSLCSLRWNTAQTNVIDCLCVLATENGSQSFDDVVLMVDEVSPHFLLILNRHPISDTIDDVDKKGETERVECKMPGSDGFSLDFIQLDSSSKEDKLMTGTMISPHKFKNFPANFFLNKRIKLHQMHIILNKLQ